MYIFNSSCLNQVDDLMKEKNQIFFHEFHFHFFYAKKLRMKRFSQWNSWKVIFSLAKFYDCSRQLLLSKYVMYVMCMHVFFPMAIYVVPKYWNYTQMAHLYFFMLCLSRISLEFCVKNQFGNYGPNHLLL